MQAPAEATPEVAPTPVVDALAHLDDRRISDLAAVMARAEAAGVTDIVSAGFDPLSWTAPWTGIATKVRVWRAVGLHPRAIRVRDYNRQLAAVERALKSKGVVAIGEIGLDARPGDAPLDMQAEILRRQLDMARRYGVPVILHCVKAIGRLVDVVREAGPYPAGGILHAFSGPPDLVRTFIDLNISLSFGGLVSDTTAVRCRNALGMVPKKYLLVESDTPDHPPQGFEGKFSEPAAIVQTLKVMATLRKESPTALAELTAANARRIFGFDAGLKETSEGDNDGTSSSGARDDHVAQGA